MTYSTTNAYTLKWEISSFASKFSKRLSMPDRKFAADMTYDILASRSRLLTDIVERLHEKSKKVVNLRHGQGIR